MMVIFFAPNMILWIISIEYCIAGKVTQNWLQYRMD